MKPPVCNGMIAPRDSWMMPGDLADAIALPCATAGADGSIRLTSTCRRSYRKYGSSTRQYNWFLSLCSHLWSLFLIRGSRHEVHAHSASVGGGDVLAAIRDTRNRRAGASFWLCIMRASRGHRADSGLRHRTRSRDRAVAPGATPLAPETGRGRHPLALMSTWRRSRPCASCAIWNSPGSSPCAALRSLHGCLDSAGLLRPQGAAPGSESGDQRDRSAWPEVGAGLVISS
jgi:hypothetical protein